MRTSMPLQFRSLICQEPLQPLEGVALARMSTWIITGLLCEQRRSCLRQFNSRTASGRADHSYV